MEAGLRREAGPHPPPATLESDLDGGPGATRRSRHAGSDCSTGDATVSDVVADHSHLDWSHKQGRILTANGLANTYFTADRGAPFLPEELPHHHLLQGDSHRVFRNWRKIQREERSDDAAVPAITGAWFRRYFVGGWEASTCVDEVTFNLQSANLFIDMRIPTSRKKVLRSDISSLSDLTDLELRYFCRQHVFCGYSQLDNTADRLNCTRHHVLDWNFVGTPRPRPNKWYIECGTNKDIWKEWAFATDDNGQHYYCEQWERLEGDECLRHRVALRKIQLENDITEDAVFVAMGDHFQYCTGSLLLDDVCVQYPNAGSFVDMVDAAIEAGDRASAESLCARLDAGHGLISTGWVVDTSIRPWVEGTPYLHGGEVTVKGNDLVDSSCRVVMKEAEWEIFDCSFDTVEELRVYMQQANRDG